MGGGQSGDDFPDRYCDLVSDGPYRDADSQTRRMDLPGNIQIAFYRERLRFPGRYLWVVSRGLLDVADFHEWIYRSRRRAEDQWTRTLAAEHGSAALRSAAIAAADQMPSQVPSQGKVQNAALSGVPFKDRSGHGKRDALACTGPAR